MSENLEIFDWELTDEDQQKISTIPQARGSCAEFMVNEATGPYRTLQELWDDEGDSVASLKFAISREAGICVCVGFEDQSQQERGNAYWRKWS